VYEALCSTRYDTRRTTAGTPCAFCYIFSALNISVKWGTHDGMKEIRNNERQHTGLKGINAVMLCIAHFQPDSALYLRTRKLQENGLQFGRLRLIVIAFKE
jgi:hypothetical protein